MLERQQHLRLEIELQTITFRTQAKVRSFLTLIPGDTLARGASQHGSGSVWSSLASSYVYTVYKKSYNFELKNVHS